MYTKTAQYPDPVLAEMKESVDKGIAASDAHIKFEWKHGMRVFFASVWGV